MTVEQRLDQLEKRNKRLTVALTMTVVAMAAVVTMAATGEKNGDFDSVHADVVIAKKILVSNKAENTVVKLGYQPNSGNGFISTYYPDGRPLVTLTSENRSTGPGTSRAKCGIIRTYDPNGKNLLTLSATENGGSVNVFNMGGDHIAQMTASSKGYGVVTVWPVKLQQSEVRARALRP